MLIEAGVVDKALGIKLYDFSPKAKDLERNYFPHFIGEGHSDRCKSRS